MPGHVAPVVIWLARISACSCGYSRFHIGPQSGLLRLCQLPEFPHLIADGWNLVPRSYPRDEQIEFVNVDIASIASHNGQRRRVRSYIERVILGHAGRREPGFLTEPHLLKQMLKHSHRTVFRGQANAVRGKRYAIPGIWIDFGQQSQRRLHRQKVMAIDRLPGICVGDAKKPRETLIVLMSQLKLVLGPRVIKMLEPSRDSDGLA